MRTMKGRAVGGTMLLVLAACGREGAPRDDTVAAVQAGAPADPTYQVEAFDVPGSAFTVASDITDAGAIVGWFSRDSVVRGFVRDAKGFTTIEHPGAIRTQLNSMSSDGTIVGAYQRRGEPDVAWHPFVRRPTGEFVPVRHPAQPYGMAQRILDDGTVIGCYHGKDFTTTMRGTAFSVRDTVVSDLVGSMHNGATSDQRRIVGVTFEDGRSYVVEGGRVTYLAVPRAASTEAWDINDAGTIVGAAVDSAKVTRPVTFTAGRWTNIELPGASSGVAFGVNRRGDVVGGWRDSTGRRRAFVARRG